VAPAQLEPMIVNRPALPLLLALLGFAPAVDAQEPLLRSLARPAAEAPPEAEVREAAEAEPLPPIGELVPRVALLGEESDEALKAIRRLADAADLEPRVAELAERQDRLAERLDQLLGHEYVSDDRVAAVTAEAEHLTGRIDQALEAVSARVRDLAEIREEWRARSELWRRWAGRLALDAELDALYADEVARARERIAGVVEAAGGELPDLARLQGELRETAAANRRVRARAESYLSTWREDLFRRTAPLLFSAAHRQAVGPELRDAAVRNLRQTWAGEWRLEPKQAGVLLLQAAVLLGVGWLARWLRPRVAGDSRWASILRHPWAVGVLVAAAGAGFLHGPLPPLGRLALQAAVAAAAARVAAGMFRNPYKRWVVYGVSALYVLFAALDGMALPVPLLRVALAALAATGAAALVVAERRAARSPWGGQGLFRWVLRLGAAVLATAFTAEALGYHFLAHWLLEAAVATAFVAFVVSFLVRLSQGALRLALRSEAAAARFRFLRRVGGALADRLAVLIKLVLIGWAALYVASIWDLAASPASAWRSVVEAGVRVGEGELTVGRLLAAVVAVYLAFVASWVLRALLDQTFFERRRFERGIRDSIATLLHYAVVVVGVFLGLSVLGLDLSSLALVAGALGVGIGFGLQNVVNNFVSGLILLFERPVRVGDIVVLGEEWGTVQKIGLRSTTIVTFNGAELIVPNADLIAEKVTNWTLTTPRARLVIPVGVAYGTDPERVISVLEEVGRSYPLALEEPPAMAAFLRFGESSLDFELRVWLGAFEQLLEARSALGAAITRRFAAEGIEIPFPQRDLHLRSADPKAAAGLTPGGERPG
jgi:potassium-dependent mechanosensitive channel